MIHRRVWLGFAIAVLGSSCRLDPREHETPHYCCTDLATCQESDGSGELHACADPTRSFCDNHGQFPDSDNVGRTCIGEPGGRTCDVPDDCADPRAPVCALAASQTCVDCAAAADCGRFPSRPLCHPDSGACVECVAPTDCAAARPICDPDGSCRACSINNDCASQLCDVTAGSCVPEADVIYVGMGGVGVDCLRTAPCGSVQDAIGHVTATRRNIHVSSGTYFERITVDGVSFYLASDGGELRAPDGDAGPVVTIMGSATVELRALRIRNATDPMGDGVACVGAGATTVTLDDVLIEDNAGRGVDSSGCRISIVGSRIDQNAGGGVKVTAGAAIVQNNLITRNGGPTAVVGGVELGGPSTLAVDFNTIADNVASGGPGAGISCGSTVPRILSSNLVVGAASQQLAGTGCTFEYTLSNQAVDGPGNLTAAPTFVDAAGGNYHLMAGSAGIDAADPEAILTTDVDGDVRPQGARADIGADEVTP